MKRKSIARIAATAASLGTSLTLAVALAGGAGADTESTVRDRIAELTVAAGDDASARAGVDALRDYTELVDVAALRDIAANFTPFAYAAPTFGCGSNGPITTIIAAGVTEGTQANSAGADLRPGQLRFTASPAHSGAPLASGLVVAWVNVNTGASGMDPLDDRTDLNLPTLSKTVNSGPGTVLASMWGVIDYPGAHCVMTPTVGTFVVPDVPAPPAPAPQPVPPPAEPAPPAPGIPMPELPVIPLPTF
ncbi:hypothetical protein [Nocardia harenae]|uniref:hypothetical protein n=1 Tax=Nocardia harenae TaxID=358707 RepID=UPI000B0072D2|nr:hypothetical protein [Nocardia harenae]